MTLPEHCFITAVEPRIMALLDLQDELLKRREAMGLEVSVWALNFSISQIAYKVESLIREAEDLLVGMYGSSERLAPMTTRIHERLDERVL